MRMPHARDRAGLRPSGRVMALALALILFPGALALAQITVSPYLQNPAPGAVTIFWQTAEPAYGWVEYGTTEKLGQKQDWSVDGLRNANTTCHRVRLAGLPDSTIYYRVAWKPIKSFAAYKVEFGDTCASPIYRFRLPAAGQPRVTAYFMNDVHNHYDSFRSILPVLGRWKPDCILFNGDMFSDPAKPEKVAEALRIYGEGVGAASLPLFFVRGNHEARGAYARSLKSHFDFPDGKFYYGVTVGPVRFVALDLGEDKPDTNKEYSGLIDFASYRREETEWLKAELASPAFKQARWRVLVQHIPLYGDEERDSKLHDMWPPILKNAPIDAMISGHTHVPLIHPKRGPEFPFPVIIGGGRNNTTLIVLQADAQQCTIDLYDRAGNKMDGLELN